MPSTSLVSTEGSKVAATALKSDRKFKITPRMKRALDLMVWDNKTDYKAAVETGLTIQAIRFALKQPAGRAYYRDQLQVLRERESSGNIHTLIAVRDQESNQMARVQAVKALEQLSDEPTSSAHSQKLPGLVVQINVAGVAQSHPPVIDVTPQDRIRDSE